MIRENTWDEWLHLLFILWLQLWNSNLIQNLESMCPSMCEIFLGATWDSAGMWVVVLRSPTRRSSKRARLRPASTLPPPSLTAVTGTSFWWSNYTGSDIEGDGRGQKERESEEGGADTWYRVTAGQAIEPKGAQPATDTDAEGKNDMIMRWMKPSLSL